jgi:hypothetical protein
MYLAMESSANSLFKTAAVLSLEALSTQMTS